MFEAHAIIGGSDPARAPGATFDRTDPLTSEVITRAAACSEAVAADAAGAAAAAHPAWAATDPAERARVLLRAADLLEARKPAFVEVAHREVGATADWTHFNIAVASDTLRHCATLTDRIGSAPYTAGNPGVAYTRVTRPVGVVLGIAPWNAPVTLAVRAVAAPLALGNTVVLKGSELCPRTHEMVAQALLDAGLPDGAINYVVNAPDDAHAVVEALIAHPAVRRVNFTDSTRVGREVALIAARHLKRCLLELSGKAPVVVLAGADIAAAARVVAQGAFFNQGQICMSTDRVIVEDAIAEPFVAALRAEAEALRLPDLAAPPGAAGQLITADAALRVKGLIEDAVRKGATLVTGGESFNRLMQPTVLDHVTFGMRIYAEETFGPALGIIRVADADEAVSVANDSDFALAAAVWSRDTAAARQVAHLIEAGIVHVNGSTVYDDPALPFGGLKASGYGRFGGDSVVAEFTETSFVTQPRATAAN
ncbi:aldehyde dehydrogenase family protein [Citreimonas sp.]|uniref:aldehyde dehydrogenase family protein n=1 Tax=Citreimonas sp. TaxID=3036715 RepID=UPI0040595D1A